MNYYSGSMIGITFWPSLTLTITSLVLLKPVCCCCEGRGTLAVWTWLPVACRLSYWKFLSLEGGLSLLLASFHPLTTASPHSYRT